MAPTVRATDAEIAAAARDLLLACPALRDLLESVPHPAGVFDEHRQLLLCNRAMERAAAPDGATAGRRPGEIFGCVNADLGSDGCGTAPGCATCGGSKALSESLMTSTARVGDCRIRARSGSGFDFVVRATPLQLGSQKVAIAVFSDASSDKRREVLERVFFHDLLNTASGLAGIADALGDPHLPPGEDAFFRQQLTSLASHLLDEIRSHRRLTEAESGTMAVRPEPLNVREVVESVANTCAVDLPNRTIRLGPAADLLIVTDLVLLRRVLSNLLRNALEASSRDEPVTLWCDADDHFVSFRIHNKSAIPAGQQTHIFQRSFTTKGESGRGLGTYSAKLFTERYLHGRLSFVSAEPNGTVFSVDLPWQMPAVRSAVRV
jgi:hypothetical protein